MWLRPCIFTRALLVPASKATRYRLRKSSAQVFCRYLLHYSLNKFLDYLYICIHTHARISVICIASFYLCHGFLSPMAYSACCVGDVKARFRYGFSGLGKKVLPPVGKCLGQGTNDKYVYILITSRVIVQIVESEILP